MEPAAPKVRASLGARLLAGALLVASLGGYLLLADLRDSWTTVRGDEGTYLAMAESLALDGDLRLTPEDAERLVATGDPGRQAVILQQAGDGHYYSKPALYPLLAAPFYRLIGPPGLVLLNLLALGAGLWCAWLYLRRFDADRALLTVASFACTGTLLAYVAWRTADLVQVAAVLAGMVLCLGPVPRRGLETTRPLFAGPAAAFLGGALLGAAGSLRITNLVLVAGPVLALVLAGQRRRAAHVVAGTAAVLLLGLGLNWALAGAPSPYRTTRATFDTASGYPSAAELAENRYETSYSKVRVRSPRVRPAVSAYAALYFLIGRNSGLLLYTPLALLLLAAALRRPDPTGASLLLAAGGLTLLYLLWLPHNYFGGGACIGNRYFLVAYAALPLAVRPLGAKKLSIAWLLAAVALASALQSQRLAGDLDRSSQSHAHAGVFRWLPYESTAASIEGSSERFWPRDEWELIHFADPFARVGDWSFRLATGMPPAELEVANPRPSDKLRFLVLSEARRLHLIYEDWRGARIVELRRPLGANGLVEIEPAPAWRRHPLWFWWQLRDPFTIRTFRLAIETPDGSPAEAELRYLGSLELPDHEFFQRTVLAAELPEIAAAGGRSSVSLEVRNDGDQPWLSGDVLPVHLGYRLACGGTAAAEGPRIPLAETVMPDEVLSTELEVQWPEVAATCDLTVDLVVEGVAWFAAEAGAPLAAGSVELRGAAETPADDSQRTDPTATPSRRMSRERRGAGAGSR